MLRRRCGFTVAPLTFGKRKNAMSQHALDLVRSKGKLPARYGNFIGGKWVEPTDGQYFTDYSPINGERLVDVAKSAPRDVEMALVAAHKAKDAWARISPAERSLLLNKVADRMEENLELLALAETLDNGKPIRETKGADVPLAIDHFRYFAGCIRAEEGAISTIDNENIPTISRNRSASSAKSFHGISRC